MKGHLLISAIAGMADIKGARIVDITTGYRGNAELNADFPDANKCDDFIAFILGRFGNVEYTRDQNFIIIWERV